MLNTKSLEIKRSIRDQTRQRIHTNSSLAKIRHPVPAIVPEATSIFHLFHSWGILRKIWNNILCIFTI
jgi:hypothetical protein